MMNEREIFLDWWQSKYKYFHLKTNDGEWITALECFVSPDVQELWEAWQARAAKVPKGFSIDPFRSGGFINKDCDMGRVYIDLPIAEARQLLAMLNKEGA